MDCSIFNPSIDAPTFLSGRVKIPLVQRHYSVDFDIIPKIVLFRPAKGA